MDFKEAVKLLKQYEKVSRTSWDNEYISLEEKSNAINRYYMGSSVFHFSADIILSTGWHVCGNLDEDLGFPDAITKMKQGRRIKLKTWDEKYITLDGRDLIVHQLCELGYRPTFEDFNAVDWEIYRQYSDYIPESKL
jgi:hypothetical protein